ncbi:MAG: hypothetical protein J6A25_05765 [Lachnospiraceae bacterium]|nr:hypothetical protein [Lachnospiraceae bacterium]
MRKYISNMPIQKLPMSKKTEEWRKDCIDYFIGISGFSSANSIPDEEELQSYYDLYNGLYNEKDLKYVTNPFNQDDGFPAMAQDYNIIRPKIDLLLGEETKRPFNFKVCRTSDIASSEVQDKAKQMLLEYVQAAIMAQLGPEEQARFQQALDSGEVQTPEQIHKYLTQEYKDIAEITAYHALQYLIKKLNLPHEFVKGFKHALCGGLEFYYVGIRNGDPFAETVNTKDFKYPAEEGVEFVDESSWCVRRIRTSWASLYDDYYDYLDEKQLNKLLEIVGQQPTSGYGPDRSPMDYNHIDLKRYNTINGYMEDKVLDDVILYHVCWKSCKKIGFVTILNPETGLPEEFQVDESYKEVGTEINVEWKWILETWEGYCVEGNDDEDSLYFGMQPVEYQFENSSTLNSAKLPYTGVAYSNTNSKAKSLVAVMKPLQYMYIVLWYRLELAIARDKGKVPLVDVTTIPKSMGIDVDKWMHYLSALGVAFINPYEEGWQVPGREGGKPSSFSNYTSLDLTMGNTINTYIGLLDKIEQMVSELSGITQQRQGAISSNELVGNVERSVVQSAHITEPWFWLHNQCKKRVLSMLLDTAKYAWKDSREYLNYLLDDTTRAFLKLDDNFSYEDFDIFVSDSTKDNQLIDQVRSLVQPAMQNGASMLDIVEVLTLDNLSMIKTKLQEIETKRMEQQQAMQEQEAQQQQQLVQMQNEVKEQELMLKEAELDLEKYKIDQDNATKITVAQLNAYRNAENMDQDMNGIPDPIEIGKQEIERQKAVSDAQAKQMDLANKMRAEENKKEIEKRKIDAQKEAERLRNSIEKQKIELEKKKLVEAKKLQAQKDKAAMERERLKAKTALKNKVAGESKSKKK